MGLCRPLARSSCHAERDGVGPAPLKHRRWAIAVRGTSKADSSAALRNDNQKGGRSPLWLGAVGQGDVGCGVGGADVVGARADEAVVVVLLDDVGGPSGD